MTAIINDFVATIEAINDGELTVAEAHETYTNVDGYWEDDILDRMIYARSFLDKLIELATDTRASV